MARCLGITIGVNYRPAALSLSAPPVRPGRSHSQSACRATPPHHAVNTSPVNIPITVSPSMNPSAVAAAVARHQVSTTICHFFTKLQVCRHERRKLFDNKKILKVCRLDNVFTCQMYKQEFCLNPVPYHKVVL